MILTAENLGPLKRASIDLSRDLILLTGPNNTGKTYLAWSVYGLHRMESPQGLDALVAPALDAMLARGETELDLEEALADHWDAWGARIAEAYTERVAHDFAIHPDRFRDTRFGLQLRPGDVRHSVNVLCFEDDAGTMNSVWYLFHNSDSGRLRIRFFRESVSERIASSAMQGRLDESLAESLALEPSSERLQGLRKRPGMMSAFNARQTLFSWPRIFPAERIATNVFARELSVQRTRLVDELLERAEAPGDRQADLAEFVQERAQRYPLPIQDSLRVAVELEHLSQRKSAYADLADELEASILGGKVGVSAHGQLSFTPDGAPGVEVHIHHAASMVKSLGSLVFYLRHLAAEGELVIIDEPELNLHPDNQRAVARFLARMVNRGLRVLASTHSDYLIREFNHLVMLAREGEAMARTREELGYPEDCLLSPQRMGVYYFDGTGNQEIPVDERGFEVSSIEAAIEDMNATSQAIYAALLDD